MKRLSIFFLIGITVLAGCLSQKAGPSGIISSTLVPDTLSAQAGSTIGIILKIDNQAKNPIKNVDTSLYGPTEWKIDGKDITTANYHADLIPSLSSIEKSWIITVPRVNTQLKYTIFAKVKYDYEFERDAILNLVTLDYFKRTKTKPSITPYPFKMDGPVKIEFSDLDKVTFIYGTIEPTLFPLKIIISNIGSGKAYIGEPKVNLGLNKVKVTITQSSNILKLKDCTPTLISSSETNYEFLVDLVDDGAYGVISCNAEVAPGYVADLNTIRLAVKASYSYIEDIKTPEIVVNVK